MALLGKGPVSDESNDTLCCADIKRKGLRAPTPRSNVDNCINLSIEVSAVAPPNGRWFIAASRQEFAFLDPQDCRLDQIEDLEAEFPDYRFNDGTVNNLGILSMEPCTI